MLILPCKNQERFWTQDDIEIYDRILEEADEVVCLSERYRKGSMHMRYRHLVDRSGICVCYLTKDTGGTAYTVKYAKRKGLRIINIAD